MLSAIAILILNPKKVESDIVYSRVPGAELKMDVYYPENLAKKNPAVLVFHGGAWIYGDKRDMKSLCESFARQGVVSASVQYRLAPKTRWPGFYNDAQTAVRFLRENADKYKIDPKRIGAAGLSAGGHLALMVGFTDTHRSEKLEYPRHSSQVKAVLNIFGPTDMSRDYPPSYDTLFQAILGKERKNSTAEIKAASPVNFVNRQSPPVFIIHGTADPVVPVSQGKWLESRLRANGVPVQARYIEGMKHEILASNTKAMQAMREGVTWLADQLSR